jgi:hypothetical protein
MRLMRFMQLARSTLKTPKAAKGACTHGAVYAVYAISSLEALVHPKDTAHRTCSFVGTHQGVAGLTPRPFTLEEETGPHHGHGHVHRTPNDARRQHGACAPRR